MSNLKVGDQVRLKVSEHRRVGTVVSVADGMVAVRYEHQPQISTHGYYPVGHVDLVQVEGSKVQVQTPTPAVKPKATTAQIIGRVPGVINESAL